MPPLEKNVCLPKSHTDGTPEEGWRMDWPKRHVNNTNNNEFNHPKNSLNVNDRSQKL